MCVKYPPVPGVVSSSLSALYSLTYLVQYPVVVGLRYTDELAVITLGSHHAPVVQFLHCRRDAETGERDVKVRRSQ